MAGSGSSHGGRFVLWLLLLACGAMTAYLAAERNARRWTLEMDHEQLVVSRGRHFVLGSERIHADDPVVGKTYGPIPVPGGTTVAAAEFDDQVSLDRAIFEALLPAVRAAKDGDTASRARAEAILGRLSDLPGLTPSQLGVLASIRGDFAYDAARAELRDAARLVQQAWRKMQLVRGGTGEHALEAAAMEPALQNIAVTLEDVAAGRVPRPSSAVPQATPSR